MSGTIYSSVSSGDWNTAAIWSTDAVPDGSTADVTIDTGVTISNSESFTAGTLDVGTLGILDLLGSLDVTGGSNIDGGVSLEGGVLNAAGGLTLDTLASVMGGRGTVTGSIDNAGLIYASGGLLDLAGSVGGSGPMEIDLATGTSSTLELGQGGTEAVAFVGLDPSSSAQGVLKLDQPGSYSGTISGFALGEALDLAGLAPGTLTKSFSGNTALGTLVITNGASTVASLNFAGDYTHSSFTLVSDGQGGTDVQLVPPASETTTASGDWGNPAIWDLGLVPNNTTTETNIPNSVTIAANESFVAGSASIAIGGLLDVAGSLSVAGAVTVDDFASLILGVNQFAAPTISGFVGAASVDVALGGRIEGRGTLASSGTLTNDGIIQPVFSNFAQLTLAPAVYQQGKSGILLADAGTLVLAPTTGAAGFVNLVNGTLSDGEYSASGATLTLPAPVTEIANAVLALDGAATIETGGVPITDTLGTIGSGGFLSLTDYDYTSANTLTVDGGKITLVRTTLSPADLVLVTGSISGSGTISSNIENNGRIAATDTNLFLTPAVLDLTGSVSGSGSLEIAVDSTLELGGGGSAAVTFDPLPQFTGETPAVLQLDHPRAYAVTISGFTAELNGTILISDSIDLPGFAPRTLTDVYNGSTAEGVLDVLAPGSIVASLTFVGDYTSDNFALVSNGKGGTDILLIVPGAVPCFAHGTRIATPRGEIAVEDLRVGDRALTASGDARPVVWIGQRSVDCTRHPRTDLVHPVHIRPDAFAEGRPKRDLFLSPDHALFCDGVLIPVHCLINGATVVQEQAASVQYFHIELDRHDIVLAEGLPAESYLNTGNRAQFENGAAHVSLHADFTPRGWDDANAYAPLCTRGPIVEALNRRLWQRAVELGSGARGDPNLRVEVDGRVFQPAAVKGPLHRFLLPAHAREARIVSRAGVRLGAILVDSRIVALDSPALAEGFYPPEGTSAECWRRTDRRALLLLPDGFGHPGSVLLELLVRDMRPNRQSPRAPAALALAA